MPDIDLSYEATTDDGRDQRAITETGQAGLAASLQERQQRAVTSQYPREQAQLQERLTRLSDALGDRVDPQQVETFRQGQMDQLRERQDDVRQLYEAAQSAVARLDQQQQRAYEQSGHLQQLADEQPGQQRDASRPYERQQAGLVDLVNQVLSELSGMQDQQNACLRQQRQEALAAAGSGAGGDLSQVLDRQQADRDAMRDQLSRIRQDLDRSSRDPAALGGPASDAIRTARQGPSPQRSADTQRERDGQRAAGEAGQAGLAASLHERQQQHERVVAGQDRREQARLQDRLDQLGERVKGRVDPRQLDALRQGQTDQLRERQDASRQLREAVRAAVAQLDQQQNQARHTATQPDQQQAQADLHEQQRAGLAEVVSRVLSDLPRVQDQQNAYMRRQRQDTLAAAAAGADLSQVLDRQQADRNALRDQLNQLNYDLDQARRQLATTQPTAQAGRDQDAGAQARRDQDAVAGAGMAGLAASMQRRQERTADGGDAQEQAQLQQRLAQFRTGVQDRAYARQLDAFRQGQLDQLRERQDGSRQLLETARAAAARLDQQQNQPRHAAASQPEQQQAPPGLHDQQRAGLAELVNRVLPELAGIRDQQNAALRQQRKDAQEATATGADLSQVLDRQQADRNALRNQLNQLNYDLDQASRQLATTSHPTPTRTQPTTPESTNRTSASGQRPAQTAAQAPDSTTARQSAEPAPGASAVEQLDEETGQEYRSLTGHNEPEDLATEDRQGLTVYQGESADVGSRVIAKQRIADARRMLGVIGMQPGQARRAREHWQALDWTNANNHSEGASLLLTQIEQDFRDTGHRASSRGDMPTIEASLRNGARPAFDQAMALIEDYPEIEEYAQLIRQLYEQKEIIDVGASIRQTDPLNQARTNSMRSQFLRCSLPAGITRAADPVAAALRMTPWGGAIPEAVDLVRNHLKSALERAQWSAKAAVDNGDAVWLNAVSGKHLAAWQAGAVLWPATQGKVWEMDHGIELQHGGHDFVDNYVPAPPSFHRAKSDAMREFGRSVWALAEDEQ